MNKQIVPHPYNGILLSKKKKQIINIHKNINKSQNNYT